MNGTIDRRTLLRAGALLGLAAPAIAAARDGFASGDVEARARALAARPFVPAGPLPPSLRFSYDEYRMLRYRRAQALWQPGPIIAEPMPPGGYFADPVAMTEVAGGVARPIPFDPALFDAPPGRPLPADPGIGFSGVRFLGPLNDPTVRDEIAVFQGASYFRALAKGQLYGISARALAIGTGGPAEEFPVFRAFWLERPTAPGAITLHALLDGPSVTGAYHMTIRPGAPTIFDVAATLYPRRPIAAVGIAPMSSMFMSGPASARRFDDFRPAVHDSDGLSIWTGAGEQIWRPLRNPARVEVSAFADEDPQGFGLMQRARAFADYADAEARYDRRPSLWVEPRGAWGKGSVQLVELPSDNETGDNIAAFWRPAAPLAAGRPFALAYRLYWTDESPAPKTLARVKATRTGASFAGSHPDGSRAYAIDFEGNGMADLAAISADASASGGTLRPVRLERLPGGRDVRASLALLPAGDAPVDLRLTLRRDGRPISETVVARWQR